MSPRLYDQTSDRKHRTIGEAEMAKKAFKSRIKHCGIGRTGKSLCSPVFSSGAARHSPLNRKFRINQFGLGKWENRNDETIILQTKKNEGGNI